MTIDEFLKEFRKIVRAERLVRNLTTQIRTSDRKISKHCPISLVASRRVGCTYRCCEVSLASQRLGLNIAAAHSIARAADNSIEFPALRRKLLDAFRWDRPSGRKVARRDPVHHRERLAWEKGA